MHNEDILCTHALPCRLAAPGEEGGPHKGDVVDTVVERGPADVETDATSIGVPGPVVTRDRNRSPHWNRAQGQGDHRDPVGLYGFSFILQ